MEFIKMSDFDPTTNPNYNPPGGDGDGNGGGLGNGQGGGSADANNPPGGDGDGNGGGLGDGNGMNINGTGNGTDPTDPNYNPPGGDGDGEGNGDGNGEGNEGAGDGSNLPGGDGDGNGGGLGDGNGMNTNGAGNISEDSGNTNNLPADGSILLLSEQIGMIDANVYLFKNTEDGVSLERLNKADPAVDNEYVGSGGIYELTDSSDAELIQQISAANGSDNHLVYEEASIVAGNTDDGDEIATFTAKVDQWQSDGMGAGMDAPSMKLYRKDIADNEGIDLTAKDGHPGHKHIPDMDKGSYELRVEHDQQTDGAIDMEDVKGVLSLSRGLSSASSKEHTLAADWNGDGIIDIDDVMGVLARSRGLSKEDEWRFHDKTSDTSLWDNTTKANKMDIVLESDEDIELTAILRGDVNASYNADQHNRSSANDGNGSGTGGGGGNGSGAGDGSGGGKAALTPNYALLPINNDDELQNLHLDIV